MSGMNIVEKKIAIINSTINTSKAVAPLFKEAFPKRRLFGKIDRRPLKRIKKKRALVLLMIQTAMGAAQIATIQAQPIRKFASGN
jgi:hypothetical protein